MGLRYRELNPLVLADGPAEDDPLVRVAARLASEPFAIADALRRDQDAFRVEPVQECPEALALDADEILRRDLEAVEEDLARVVVQHRPQGAHFDPASGRLVEIDEQDREPLRLPADLVRGSRASQQQHQIRVFDARGENLLSMHDVAVSGSHCAGLQLGGVGAGRGLGDAERLEP